MTNAVAEAAVSAQAKMEAVQAYMMAHVLDSHHWGILPYVGIPLPPWLSVHALMLLVSAAIVTVICFIAARRTSAVPTGLTHMLELVVIFVRDQIAVPALGPDDGRRMTPVFCSFFTFIMTVNLLGLLPCVPVPTANLAVTGALATVTFLFMTLGAIIHRGPVAFIRGFMPRGVPWPILILVAPLEFLGLFIKAFALTIRLFANMLAGHMVLFSLVGLVVIFGVVALPAMVMALGIYMIEVFIALLQAYIFTLLSAIFIGQQYRPEHGH